MTEFLLFMMGASFGSFFGLVIVRFPEQSIISPASHCDLCRQQLAYRDLIPIFSQLINRFRCRFCKKSFAPWYWLLELVCGFAFLFASHGFLTWTELLLIYAGLLLSYYDCKNQTYPLMVWLVFFMMTSILSPWNTITLACLLLAGLAQLGFIKMGAGDFLYLASISLAFDLQELLWLLQIACLTAIFYYLVSKRRASIPFVPFLFLGFLLVLGIGKWG
ncbi:A24 family peptidase [Streptococcus merionis]|uniref:prepilin peptidase n=1 Tax=Streptococcus merionis TaxID=400065 RepID=UPI0026F0844C|nr:A24 family peptidase [Streptococcus merionis]